MKQGQLPTALMKGKKTFFAWLLSTERRGAKRRNPARLIAHYWDGAAPQAHVIRDISASGLFMKTDHRWYPGTLVKLSLQRAGAAETEADRAIMVHARVMRSDADGVGLEFILPKKDDSANLAGYTNYGADRKTLERFLGQLWKSEGQALAEYILVLPLLFVLVINLVNFGAFFYAWITVANAARAAADYAVMGGASVGATRQGSPALVQALIAADIASLPNQASLVVNICRSSNGTVAPPLLGTCTSIPSDAEAASYVLTTIDVTYTYLPVISTGFRFANMNVYASLPPTTLHRRAVMRVLQ